MLPTEIDNLNDILKVINEIHDTKIYKSDKDNMEFDVKLTCFTFKALADCRLYLEKLIKILDIKID